ncbi:DUF998 domain-containing protein [Plantactinospora endophytica]|uniref:DUF998 domain-containing protein n=1 Tax=Plantactinospora endophytica TaxID=673535 RepID=A0ABQ4E6H6_9ACTN|nr:DUF998 domain-containing protein [Plantactinospora endophytica]GIG90311.1 hypothetical protein Pen02_52470 [Plantactinospora endophytica]
MSRAESPIRPVRPVGVRRAPRHDVVADAVPVGLVLPFVGFAVADLGTRGWSPVERMVSHYVHAPGVGWLVPVGLLTLGVASAGLLRLAVARTEGGRTGLWLLGVWAVAVLVGAAFPTDPYGQWDRPPSPAGTVHGLAGLTAFAVLPVAAVLLTRVWRRDPRWRSVHRMLTVSTVLCVLGFLGFAVIGVDVMTDGPALTFGRYESVAGLAERVLLWSYALWLCTAATGLHRIVRQERVVVR